MTSEVPGPRLELGRELKRLRLEHGLTLQELAERLGYRGSKGTFSEYERGTRVVPAPMLRQYEKHLGADVQRLLKLRANSLLTEVPGSEGGEATVPVPSDPPEMAAEEAPGATSLGLGAVPTMPPAARGRHGLLSMRILLPVGVLVIALVLLSGALLLHGRDRLQVTVAVPTGTAPYVSPVSGRVSGLDPNQELWLATQVNGETRFHPPEQTCTVIGSRWEYPQLYLGRQSDHGRRFRILVLTSTRGSAGQQFLIDYAQRPKNTPNPYLGVPALPPDVQVVAESQVVRD